jgi:hypothetical protein
MSREKSLQTARKKKASNRRKSHKKQAKKPIRLLFGTSKNCRQTLARLTREFHTNHRANIQRFRALCYSIRTMAEMFRAENEQEVLNRLTAIEERLRGLNA